MEGHHLSEEHRKVDRELNARILIFPVLVLLLFSGCGKTRDKAKADCDIDRGPCVRTTGAGGITVIFDIYPKPVRPLSELVFTVLVKKGEEPVADATVVLDLTMPGMYMGVNEVILLHRGGGRYEGKGAIVRCPTGRRLWKAEVKIVRPPTGPDQVSAAYIFEVKE